MPAPTQGSTVFSATSALQRHVCAPHRRPLSAGAVGGAATAGKAATDTLVTVLAVADMPLWILGLKCLGSAAAVVCAAATISRILNQRADDHDEGEDLQNLTSTSDDTDAWTAFGSDKDTTFRTAAHAFWIALHRPAAFFLPIIAAAYSVKEVESYLRAILLWQMKHRILSELQHSMIRAGLRAFKILDHVIKEIDEIAIIFLGVWVLLRFKDRMVQLLTIKGRRAQAKAESKVAGGYRSNLRKALSMERVLLPFSSIASWSLVAIGVVMSLHVVGINVQPLLTVGGVSGVIVGLSAQSVMANLISGVNVFLSQPFVVGERVSIFTSSGSVAFAGTVEAVYPMRTVLRDDLNAPSIIPNKVLSDMIVKNESRVGPSHVLNNYKKMRYLFVPIALRYKDFHAVEPLIEDLYRIIEKDPMVDDNQMKFIGLASYVGGLQIAVHLHTTGAGSRSFGSFRTRLLVKFGKAVEARGASLAVPMTVMAGPDDNPASSALLSSMRRSASPSATGPGRDLSASWWPAEEAP